MVSRGWGHLCYENAARISCVLMERLFVFRVKMALGMPIHFS